MRTSKNPYARAATELHREGLLTIRAVDQGLPTAVDVAADIIEREVESEVAVLRETVQWISDQQNLFFAECSQAEEIIARCRKALT